ncbi:acyltransferase [Bowmanella sp. Y26]|uniref:acyltransferase family protein n=1 Tax=Bowmanella yangjiangensis TaxID=2811230 RepID=UPI001BDCCBEA|nr:acyltransferase family protein [Bowmanella yangjiangensis]MBT1064840.1 acyltransferase [Bowmanella yangjiangensis]
MTSYRREIDGLRAIAVIPVLFFHAGFDGFQGGFIGVDIFFVLSGYLISSIIQADLQQNKFSILTFYERRARRILPALFFMLLVSGFLAYSLIDADAFANLAQSSLAVLGFVSNLYFYLESGYFAPSSEELLLLHTWSLAVEEQFYVVFPLLLALIWKYSRTQRMGIIIALILLSLVYSIYLGIIGQKDANFYLPFGRSWELLAGALVALSGITAERFRRWQQELMSLLALLVLFGCIIFYDSNLPWPSLPAVLPVSATLILLLFCTPCTFIGKLLCHPLMVGVGLISYSLYLWHNPLFAIARIKSLQIPSQETYILLILLSVLLAYLSWRYVEAPFRDKQKVSKQRIFKFSAVGAALIGISALVVVTMDGLPQRFLLPNLANTIQHSPKRNECHTDSSKYLRPQDACRYFSKPVKWAVLGDSHGVELAYALGEILAKQHQGLLHLTFSSCPPTLAQEVTSQGCQAWTNEAVYLLEHSTEITHVVLTYRYSAYWYGFKSHQGWQSPKYFIPRAYQHLPETKIGELHWQGLTAIITRLLKAGKTLYLTYPIPELPHHINKLITPRSIWSDEFSIELDKALTLEEHQHKNVILLEKMNSLPFSERLIAIDPSEIFCDAIYCSAAMNGNVLYFDDNHPSLYAASLIARKIKQTELTTPSVIGAVSKAE